MPYRPETVTQQELAMSARRWALQVAELAVQLAAQSGERIPRPVPAAWLDRAMRVHQQELDHLYAALHERWRGAAD